ncbi:MAG: Hsp20/alpha crystallin family protein [Clostridia bacterium]|nr:Hsp20/alpha crystallin family protein [Clostridia bacterium]
MKNTLQTRNNRYDIFDAFDDFFKPMFFEETKEVRTNIKETETHYELDLAMPGFKKDQIKISLENGYLTVSAEKSRTEEENKHYLRREISESCQRSYYVGTNVSQSDIKAKYDGGILSLTVPKDQPKQVKETYIAIE